MTFKRKKERSTDGHMNIKPTKTKYKQQTIAFFFWNLLYLKKKKREIKKGKVESERRKGWYVINTDKSIATISMLRPHWNKQTNKKCKKKQNKKYDKKQKANILILLLLTYQYYD